MKLVIALIPLVALVAGQFKDVPEYNTAYNYYESIGIPAAKRIRFEEEEYLRNPLSRVYNGHHAALGQFPYQAGLLGRLEDLRTGVCGGIIIADNRVLTAAHCWFDGQNQIVEFTVVLGSTTLFFGGTRLEGIKNVIMHPNWNPQIILNDVAIIALSSPLTLSNSIGVIALPSGSDLSNTFADETAIASGYGSTGNLVPIGQGQVLSYGEMPIITNFVCWLSYPAVVNDGNICASTSGSASTCPGDSGGPLVVQRNNGPVLIGVVSFGTHPLLGGCESGRPVAFARVTHFMDFITSNM